jgi:ABC-2 type transport system ATP-binding protein
LANSGKAVLFSSHELDTVERLSSRVAILHKGKVVANDSVTHLQSMMKLPNLESIFAQLAVEQDSAAIAQQMMDLIHV